MRIPSAVASAVVVVLLLAAAPNPDPAWSARMSGMAGNLVGLLVDLSTDQAATDPVVRARVVASATAIAAAAHEMKGAHAPDRDPTIAMMSQLFADEAALLPRSLARGTLDHARGVAAGLVTYCIGCHTRSARAPALPPLDASVVDRLPPFQRGELLAATRRFDESLAIYTKLVDDQRLVQDDPLLWEKAVGRALTISIRQRRDPGQALALVETVLATPDAPEDVLEAAHSWRASILAWRRTAALAPSSHEGRLAEARALVEQARAVQGVPADRAADVLWLRATGAVHDVLAKAPVGPHVAQCHQWLGMGYEALRDLDVWSLDMLHFEACVRSAPHTALSGACFERYERRALVEFGGNGGAALPDDVEAHLRTLRAVARPR